MKKRLVAVGAGVVVGSMLLMSAVYAGIGDSPGYDAYKSAVKHTAQVDNVTNKVNFSVTDNGAVLMQVSADVKAGGEGRASADITLQDGTKERSFQFYAEEDMAILKTDSSDAYLLIEPDEAGHRAYTEQEDLEMAEGFEKVMDAIAGKLKNNVTLKEHGSEKEIALHLEGAQIPALANTIGSLIIKAGGQGFREQTHFEAAYPWDIDVSDLKNNLPVLTDDITIDAVSLHAMVDADNRITSQTASIAVSGRDSEGAMHRVVAKLALGFSAFNHTTPDTIDLTGKQVEKLDLSR